MNRGNGWGNWLRLIGSGNRVFFLPPGKRASANVRRKKDVNKIEKTWLEPRIDEVASMGNREIFCLSRLKQDFYFSVSFGFTVHRLDFITVYFFTQVIYIFILYVTGRKTKRTKISFVIKRERRRFTQLRFT